MSGGQACKCGRREMWRVRQYRHNNSTFHGGFQNSQYSGLMCLACEAHWRTKAPYADSTKQLTTDERERWLRGDREEWQHGRASN